MPIGPNGQLWDGAALAAHQFRADVDAEARRLVDEGEDIIRAVARAGDIIRARWQDDLKTRPWSVEIAAVPQEWSSTGQAVRAVCWIGMVAYEAIGRAGDDRHQHGWLTDRIGRPAPIIRRAGVVV